MTAPYQQQVNTVPSPGVPGTFASSNPRFTLDAGPGGLVAGAAGVTYGRFAWAVDTTIDADNAPATVNSFGSGVPSGFCGGAMNQAIITTYLADSSLLINAGFMVTLFTEGDFFVKNDGTTQALVGQKAYADLATGKVSFAATGNPAGATFTGSIAAQSGTFTGSISGNTLTVSTAPTNPIVNGAFLSGTVGGSGVVAGTQIISQLTGTTNGIGTYALNIAEQLVGAGALTVNYGVLTVSAVSAGSIEVGGLLTGTGVTGTATAITALGTGGGGVGTYYLNNTQTMSSSALTSTTNVETAFVAVSSGLPGETVKMTRRWNAG